MKNIPVSERFPSVDVDKTRTKANVYIDGIFTAHVISKEAKEMALKIMIDVMGEYDCNIGRKAFCVWDVPLEKVDELSRRLVHLWRADSGLEPPGT